MLKLNEIYNEDCLVGMKKIDDNSIDAIITDPPYGISFMNRKWDYEVPSIEIWKECLRVLKPGAHLLAFAGTRTQHRMAVNIEDTGFEIRDIIAWIYGSGFPKSLSIGKAVNSLETKEWSNIGKALDNLEISAIIEVWKRNSNNVKIVETQSEKNQIEIGICMPKSGFAQVNVVGNGNQESSSLLVSFAEQNLNEAQAINTKINTALLSVEAEIRQLQNNVKSVEQQSQNQNHKSWLIFTAECDVKEWLNENTEVNHKVDEALKTLRGNKKYSSEEITNVLCVVLTDILKLTILNQSKTFQNLDTIQKMEGVSVTNVIITEYITENLISNTVAILKSKAVDMLQGNEREIIEIKQHAKKDFKDNLYAQDPSNRNNEKVFGYGEEVLTKGTSEWEGWGTALKPAMELISLCRKPISEKTIAENVLKWGTGGLNIDECRIPLSNNDKEMYINKYFDKNGIAYKQNVKSNFYGQVKEGTLVSNFKGRFPANVIHDGSDEVLAGFPDTTSGKLLTHHKRNNSKSWFTGDEIKGSYGDSGSAARFFYCAKASKAERGEDNNHPTVKPLALCQYLLKLISKENYIVLDPFLGSGTVAVACLQNNRNYIGFEIDEAYFTIAEKRIKDAKMQLKLF